MQLYKEYYVTPCGKVWSYKSNKWLKAHLGKSGYYFVMINSKPKNIHRLVAECWLENPENLSQVNHKDENKVNNKLSNLEWCTALYNINYSQGIKILDKDSGIVYDSIRAAARAKNTSQSSIYYALSKAAKSRHHLEILK